MPERPIMLTYSFDGKNRESLYMHLYSAIKKDILSGTLKTGEKLPSKRAFAKNSGVSTITVENSYSLLQAEGYIYSVPKVGYFVSEISLPLPPKDEPENNFSFKLPKPNKYKYDFVSNKTNPDNFPFFVWSKLVRETVAEKRDELMTASPAGGVEEVRDAICRHLRQFRNMSVAPEQIIVGAGTEYLYALIIQLLGRDKKYALENPGYKKVADIYKSNGVKCLLADIDFAGISVEKLESLGADIAHISPSHHYPTGIVTPISRRREILNWAAESPSRYIIEDDYDSEFRLSGRPLPTLQSIDTSGKVIYINTFTKTLASTVRIGYMVLPEKLLGDFYNKLGFYSCTVSNFEQYTLASFINQDYFEKHINRMRNYYRKIRDELLNEIKLSPLNEKCSVSEEKSGLHFLLKVNTALDDDELILKAKEKGLRISCLSQYYLGNRETAPKHILIMNYSAIAAADIKPAVTLLGNCIQSVSERSAD